MNEFGLSDKQLDLITSVFSMKKALYKAAVFGSRAKGNFKKYSDIDIAIFGDLTFEDANHIKSELEELPLIYKFDVVAYDSIKNVDLKEHIDRVGIVVYEREKEVTF